MDAILPPVTPPTTVAHDRFDRADTDRRPSRDRDGQRPFADALKSLLQDDRVGGLDDLEDAAVAAAAADVDADGDLDLRDLDATSAGALLALLGAQAALDTASIDEVTEALGEDADGDEAAALLEALDAAAAAAVDEAKLAATLAAAIAGGHLASATEVTLGDGELLLEGPDGTVDLELDRDADGIESDAELAAAVAAARAAAEGADGDATDGELATAMAAAVRAAAEEADGDLTDDELVAAVAAALRAAADATGGDAESDEDSAETATRAGRTATRVAEARAEARTTSTDTDDTDGEVGTDTDDVEDLEATEEAGSRRGRIGTSVSNAARASGDAEPAGESTRAASGAGEARPVGEPAQPADVSRPTATRSAVLHPSVQRVLDAMEQLEQMAPPKRITLDLEGLRIRIGMEDGQVRVNVLGGDGNDDAEELLEEAKQALEEQGFDLGEGDADQGAPRGQTRETEGADPEGSGQPRVRAGADDGLRL